MEGDQEHIGVIKIVRKNCLVGNDVTEDDGFFSDVPGSGSLSRSLQAQKKYMKKNLLYDENEDSEDDKAYFTKENSPNDSISKYDTDSLRSSESIEKQALLSGNNDNLVKHVNELDIEIGNAATLTDDYKIKSLLLGDNATSITLGTNVKDKSKLPEHISVSHANLAIIDHSDTQEESHGDNKVTLRERSIDGKNQEKRHTLHDFSDWGNRTNIYPDVYAPLPYSE